MTTGEEAWALLEIRKVLRQYIHGTIAQTDLDACQEVITREKNAVTAARNADRELLVKWMMNHSFATGHGEDINDLLCELEPQYKERITREKNAAVKQERERCAKVADTYACSAFLGDFDLALAKTIAAAIRATSPQAGKEG